MDTLNFEPKQVFVNKSDRGIWAVPRAQGLKPHDVVREMLRTIHGPVADSWTLAVGPIDGGLVDYYARLKR